MGRTGRGRATASLLAAIAFALPGPAFGQSETRFEPPGSDGELRVLFLGNSLTYFNDLPGMLRELLRHEGIDAVTAALAEPNFGLEDHWARQATHDRIEEGWDVVVMQQGPSATEGRPSLIEFAERFAGPIREAGATPALYMVWPAEARSFDFQGVSDSYAAAADRIDGLLFPAGEAWLDAWELDEGIALYGGDRFHPSALGSYLAALVIYEQLSGEDARELASSAPGPSGVSADDLNTLRQAAHRANADHRRAAP
ncbi:MAG TPA: hypothetical protein VLA33_08860 [Gemmatimonadota bacterium]|nr:hypothetical protein [Gemmatimonadota bacterium]